MRNDLHYVGARLLDGTRVRFFGQLTDYEFLRMLDRDKLPAGWLVWHIDMSELAGEGSDRVKALREVVVVDSPALGTVVEAIKRGLTADAFFCSRTTRDSVVAQLVSILRPLRDPSLSGFTGDTSPDQPIREAVREALRKLEVADSGGCPLCLS